MSEDDYIECSIGKGGQGRVKLVKHNGQLLARKEINVEEKGIEQCEKEVKILQELRDRNALIYKDSYYDKDKEMFYIYTEYFKNGDLQQVIEKRHGKDFELPIVIKYMRDLINVVKYIHIKGIIHRDLKTRNILVSNRNELIIGDFGLSTEIDKLDNHFVGTYSYIAPEIYLHDKNRPYSFASDIFALGCIFYEIYTLKQLYNEKAGKVEIKDQILHKYDISFERNSERNTSIENLIKRMIKKNPDTRINMNGIEERIKMMEDDIDDLSKPDSIISISSASSTAEYRRHYLTVGFYLYNESIEGISFRGLSNMNQCEFNRTWKDYFPDILFPVAGQENPPFPEEDLNELIERKSEYKENLRKLLALIRHLPNYVNSKISESIELFLTFVEMPELNKPPIDEETLRVQFFDMFTKMVGMLSNISEE